MPNVAAIDLGTNSVRLLIEDEAGHERYRAMQITRLGENVDALGALQPQAIDRTLAVLRRFRGHMDEHQVVASRVIATSAARDAKNREAFFDLVQRCLETRPTLLSGDEEARLSFLGATSSFAPALMPFVIFDIGGGSTEFARGNREPEQWLSTQLGCVRVSERFLHSDPPSLHELSSAEAEVRRWLDRVTAEFDLGAPHTWLGLAGTVTAFAAFKAGLQSYDPNVTHGLRLDEDSITDIYQRLARSSASERSKLLLEPKRAGVIVGGAVILSQIVSYFDLESILASERDILDGLAASLRHDHFGGACLSSPK